MERSRLAWFLAALCIFLGASTIMAAGLSETSNSRKLLQAACDPFSANPNTCYNADGSKFVCCAGSCSNSPGDTATCLDGSTPSPNNPPPTSGPTNPPPTSGPTNPPPTSGPTNPPPTSGPTNPPPTTAPADGTPIFNTGSNVNCFTAFPSAPNACYNADGSKYACCTGTCSGSPGATPFCPGGSVITTPSPTNPPPTSAPTNAPPTGAPTNAPPTGAPTTGPPTSAPTTAPPTNAPSAGPPAGSPVFNTGANVNCFTDFPAAPNACYGSDGSKFICCPGVCSSTPALIPSCPGAAPGVPNPSSNPTPTPTPTSASSGSCVETTGAACGNPPPTGFVGPENFPITTAGRNLITPLPDKPFATPPSRPAASGGGQSGTGVGSPNTPQSSAAGGTVAGKQVTNSYFYLPTPFATSAGGSVATCTAIGTSNSPAVNSVGVSDDQAFFRSLEHTAACGDGAQWKIRIGTGGQIYYLTSTSNGFNGANLIGPAAASFAAYTDRVIQSVAYNTELSNALCGNPPVPCEWNFHQAGGNGPTYAPLLGNQVSPGGDGVALISWPRPEFRGIDYGGDKRYRSNLYLQTWIRDVGQGSFELTWIWTNVGTVPVDFIDLPWQGLGYCPDLTHYALSVPTSVIAPDEGCPGGCKYYNHASCPVDQCWNYAYPGEGTGDEGLFNCGTQTNGWMAFASANCPLARALGVLFAPKSPAEGGPSNFGCEVRFGRFLDPNTVYGNILETIKRPVGIPAGGGTLEFRYYVTAGATLAAVATQAGRLQGFVKENVLTYGAGSVGLILAQTKVPPAVSFQTLTWYALDKVTGGGFPLIIAQHKPTGVTVITSSPYVFSCCTPSGPGAQTCALTTCVDPVSNTNFLGFIGWAVGTDVANPSPPAGLTNAVLLSSLLPAAQFFDPQHPDTEIQKDLYVVKP